MIEFAICDDEPFMLADLATLLSKYMTEKNYDFHISQFTNGTELLNSSRLFDILFLDIQMAGLDGMETARMLRKAGFQGLLIFITVLKESVFDSFEVGAYDYFVKPLDEVHFRHTLDRAILSFEQNTRKNIVVQKGNAYHIIPFDQIVYCEVLGRKIYIHTSDNKIIDYYYKLIDLEKNLDKRFARCHRSYLVNLDFIKGINSGFIELFDHSHIPVSRLREQEIIKALLFHMKERRH